MIDANELLFYVGIGTTIEYVSAKIDINKKYHVLAIYTGSTIALYLDGIIQDWKTMNGDISYTGTGDISIGSHQGDSQFVTGIIDNLVIGYSTDIPLSISSKVFPGGVLNAPFKWKLEAFGGTKPYFWSVTGLPAGLRLDPGEGTLTGIVEGDSDVALTTNVTVTDSSNIQGSQTLTLGSTFLFYNPTSTEFMSGSGAYEYATTVGRTNPQILSYRNRVYAVYQGLELDPETSYLDAQSATWSAPVKAGINYQKFDPHGHPAATVDSGGHLHVFFGANFSSMQHVVSGKQEDIATWTQYPDLAGSTIYPNLLSFSDGEILIFYATDQLDYQVNRSVDDGKNWQGSTSVINWGTDYFIYPDAGIAYDKETDEIHLSWSTYNYTTARHAGLYYARSTDRGRSWVRSDGSLLALPITKDTSEVVYYNQDEITYGEAIACDDSGKPIILFSTKTYGATSATYKMAYYSGNRWQIYTIAGTADVNRGGAVYFNAANHRISLFIINSSGLLEKWNFDTTKDTATIEKVITPFPDKSLKCFYPKLTNDKFGNTIVFFQAAVDDARSYLFSYSDLLFMNDGPTGMSAVGGDAQVTLNWNAARGSNTYNLYWSTTDGVTISTGTKIGGVSPPYTHTNLANGTTYYYAVTAVNYGRESPASTQVSAIPQVPWPGTPSGVSAAGGNAQVTVNWSPVSGASSYNVYWSTSAGAQGTKINAIQSTSYTQAGLTNGVVYYYVVTAVNAGGESPGSTQVSAMPQVPAPGTPSGVSASGGNAQATVSWNPVSTASSYNIYWSTSSGVTTTSGTRVTDVTSPYSYTGLTNGTTYYFIVTAVNAGGESPASEPVSAMTQAASPLSGKSGCFIATAVYGSYDAPEVKLLRQFRDELLLANAPGRWFVGKYYYYSPPIAEWLMRHNAARKMVSVLFPPAIALCYLVVHYTKTVLFVLLIVGLSLSYKMFLSSSTKCTQGEREHETNIL